MSTFTTSCYYVFNSTLGKSTIYQTFLGWAVFLDTSFNQLNLKPIEGYLLQNKQDTFVKTEQEMSDRAIDYTEIRIQQTQTSQKKSWQTEFPYVFKLQNTVTGKALIGILLSWTALLFSGKCPGPINDSTVIEKSGVLDWVEQEHQLISAKGVSFQVSFPFFWHQKDLFESPISKM